MTSNWNNAAIIVKHDSTLAFCGCADMLDTCMQMRGSFYFFADSVGAILFSALSACYRATPEGGFRVGWPIKQFDGCGHFFPTRSVFVRI
jgi:hypothetical protein